MSEFLNGGILLLGLQHIQHAGMIAQVDEENTIRSPAHALYTRLQKQCYSVGNSKGSDLYTPLLNPTYLLCDLY